MSDDLDRSPSLEALLSGSIANSLDRVNVALPGRVESFDDSTRRATVKPLVKRSYRDESDERQTESLPVIPEVPVLFLGSGGARIKIPVSQGDTVLLVFASASLDRWLDQDEEVDPVDDRKHELVDAVAIPGLQANASDANPLIEFTSSLIKLGASASDGVIKGSSFDSALQTWLSALRVYIQIPTPTGEQTSTYLAAHDTFALEATASVSGKVKTE